MLTHLGMVAPGDYWMIGTPRSVDPDSWWKDFFTMNLDLASATPITVTARTSFTGEFTMQSVEQWWNGEPVFRHEGESYTRKMMVLSMVDKDGGAHVDATLQAFYRALRRGDYGLGITGSLEFDGEAPFEQGVTQYAENGHLALMRLLAHEVLTTANYYKWPFVDRPIVPWPVYPTP